ncbi:MAG: DUF1080 domain-containing protein, partial [Bacteroidota bacterium]
MKPLLSVLGCCLLMSSLIAQNYTAADGWQALFNGRNLDGWYLSVRDSNLLRPTENLFTVEDETIRVYPTQAAGSEQSFAGLTTEASYSHFHLTMEYKWGEHKFRPRHEFVRDAGVIFHVHGADRIWPNGVECQIQEGDTGDLWAIGTRVSSTVQNVIRNYDPNGTAITRGHPEQRFSRFHRAYYWERPGWNKLDLIVHGDHAIFKVNGQVVNEAIDMLYFNESDQSYQPLTSGKILIQAEGAALSYRNIYLKELPPDRLILKAITDYQSIDHEGFVAPYIDKARKAIAINAVQHKGLFTAASYRFDGDGGSYQLRLRALAELDGESRYRIAINGQPLAEEKVNPRIFGTGLPDYTPATHVWQKVRLEKGDIIRVESSSETNGLV